MKRFVYFPDPEDSERLIYLNLFELNYVTGGGPYSLFDTTKTNTVQESAFGSNLGSVIFFDFTTPEYISEGGELAYWNRLWKGAIERPYTDVVIPLFPDVNLEDLEIEDFTTESP